MPGPSSRTSIRTASPSACASTQTWPSARVYLTRVVDQVDEDLIERLGVGLDRELVGDRDLDGDAARLRPAVSTAVSDCSVTALTADGAELEPVLAGIEARQVEQVGEDAREPLGVAVEAVDQLGRPSPGRPSRRRAASRRSRGSPRPACAARARRSRRSRAARSRAGASRSRPRAAARGPRCPTCARRGSACAARSGAGPRRCAASVVSISSNSLRARARTRSAARRPACSRRRASCARRR